MNNSYRTSYHFKNRIEIIELKDNPGPMPGKGEVLFSKAWADIRTMKGKEFNISKIAGNEGQSRFIIRYMKGIKASMKIKHKGLTYDIVSITNDDENNRTITIIGKAILD
jgi:SPP1 family predicted phage head-tail adaptor